MPFVKRGGGTGKLKPPKKRVTQKTQAKRKPAKKPSTPPSPKPKRTLSNFKKRKPMSSDYVFFDNNVLVVKTPAACTRWDNEFRRRIVTEYVEARTLMRRSEFDRMFIDSGRQQTIYSIMKHRIQVVHPIEEINPGNVVVLSTIVQDLTTGQQLFLSHDNPAMRSLMVYCFITGERPGGLPNLSIEAIPSE